MADSRLATTGWPTDAAPLVSVVIPTHNRRDLVTRAIKSVLAQTLPDFEIIVVDDGSTDGTRPALAALGDPRIRRLDLPERSGASRARNVGLRAARGDLVAFLDSDDEWLPTKLERQVARLRGSPDARATVVYCRGHLEVRGQLVRPTIPEVVREGDVFEHLLRGWATTTLSVFMIKRAALLEVGGFDEGMPAFHHYDLLLKLAQAANHFVVVPEALMVKHEYHGPQIATDSRAQRRGAEALDRKWRATVHRRVGGRACRRWRTARFAQVQQSQFMNVKLALERGDRPLAWRYCREMTRFLRWSRKYWVHGVALLTLGPNVYRRLARIRDALARYAGSRRLVPGPVRR